mmetsp:Transcript_17968/g.17158  ORF Transcript_17968/g.17158 Transcript_17968/m.17158 type:complete len:299 (-) Transcript_17968:577-1473(-)
MMSSENLSSHIQGQFARSISAYKYVEHSSRVQFHFVGILLVGGADTDPILEEQHPDLFRGASLFLDVLEHILLLLLGVFLQDSLRHVLCDLIRRLVLEADSHRVPELLQSEPMLERRPQPPIDRSPIVAPHDHRPRPRKLLYGARRRRARVFALYDAHIDRAVINVFNHVHLEVAELGGRGDRNVTLHHLQAVYLPIEFQNLFVVMAILDEFLLEQRNLLLGDGKGPHPQLSDLHLPQLSLVENVVATIFARLVLDPPLPDKLVGDEDEDQEHHEDEANGDLFKQGEWPHILVLHDEV